MSNFSRPMGLECAVQAICNLCANSVPYENTRAAPVLIELDAGNGQTTFTKYAARQIIKHKVRQVVGLTTYLEFTVIPKKDQMQMMFGQIASAAKGVNYYESVTSFDITALTGCVHEEQTEYFLNRLGGVPYYMENEDKIKVLGSKNFEQLICNLFRKKILAVPGVLQVRNPLITKMGRNYYFSCKIIVQKSGQINYGSEYDITNIQIGA